MNICMPKNYLIKLFYIASLPIATLVSCNKTFEADNYVAYFGGEIINPQSKEILFYKDGKVIDTILLDKNNRFLHKFDSLAPGLYTFLNAPEYQYVYFDKNDSIMIRLNAHDFDNSLAFCGRGEEKNNYLIDQYIKTENDRDFFFNIIDKTVDSFSKSIDSLYKLRLVEYTKRKNEVKWSDGFDTIAKYGVELSYYHKKELYPFIHQLRTTDNVHAALPSNYYDYRKNVNFNHGEMVGFSPYIKYTTTLINNLVYTKNNYNIDDNSLENNILKLNLADSLIKNKNIKNTVLNNIAFVYLIENQNMYNNDSFIKRYLELSTDKAQQKEVNDIFKSVQKLNVGNKLPTVSLVDKNDKPIAIETITQNKPTLLYFWSTDAKSHLISVHKKIDNLRSKYSNFNFIGINLNDSKESWKETLKNYNLANYNELKSTNFDEIKKDWVITRVHRIIILNADGTIKNGFANIYEPNFEKELL